MHTRADKSAFVCHHQIEAVGAFATFKCPKVKGRFVRIRKQPPVVKNDVLTLCEVEVKGEEVGMLYLSMYMYVSVYVCLYVCMYVCTNIRAYICMYVCLCMYVCTQHILFTVIWRQTYG